MATLKRPKNNRPDQPTMFGGLSGPVVILGDRQSKKNDEPSSSEKVVIENKNTTFLEPNDQHDYRPRRPPSSFELYGRYLPIYELVGDRPIDLRGGTSKDSRADNRDEDDEDSQDDAQDNSQNNDQGLPDEAGGHPSTHPNDRPVSVDDARPTDCHHVLYVSSALQLAKLIVPWWWVEPMVLVRFISDSPSSQFGRPPSQPCYWLTPELMDVIWEKCAAAERMHAAGELPAEQYDTMRGRLAAVSQAWARVGGG